MIDTILALSNILDYPVTVMAFVWALRLIEREHRDIVDILRECLREHYDTEEKKPDSN